MSSNLFPYFKKYQNIIWDWNGTLLNDLDIVLKAESIHFPRHGIRPPTLEERNRLFCFPVKIYYERLGFSFDQLSFEEVNKQFLAVYDELLMNAPLFHEVQETLSHVKNEGKNQFILSAAKQDHLHEILERHQIADFFDAVYGLPHTIADSKVKRGKELLEEQKIDPSTCLLIGDTEHDLEVGKHLGMEVLLIADGHHPYERLSPLHHFVIKSRY